MLTIEVAYALPDRQCVLKVKVNSGCTIEAAIRHSGILSEFPEIHPDDQPVGIFGKRCQLSDKVNEGDRIEIYRPLLMDPKDARRTKAKKARK